MIAGCTIVSPNYLPFARTLASSYLRHHPGHRFFVLLVADRVDVSQLSGEPFEAVTLESLPLEDLRAEAMKYDILELNTNVKPTFLRVLMERHGAEAVVYLDPDILVYSPLQPVFAALDAGATAALTPHITEPIGDDRSPGEQDMLYNGTFNLGFIAVRRCDEGMRLLRWWERRCLDLGFSEGRTGLFVDQKWINLAPGLFRDVAILRDAGCNMAYWNLHERCLVQVGDGYQVQSSHDSPVPLRFFHFSGVVVDDETVLSRHTDRFTLADRPDLKLIFARYKLEVRANRRPGIDEVPYGFDRLSDGTAITRLARRIYAAQYARWKGADPFDSRGAFAQFARRRRLLVAGAPPAPKETWQQFRKEDARVRAVHRLLKLALRVLGPNRYELLMRYLGHISVLRNQAVFLDGR